MNVPQIRFADFTEEWMPIKVGSTFVDYVERTVVPNQHPVLTSSQQRGIVFQQEYFADRQVTTNDNVGYFVLPRGFFTYRSRSDNEVFVFNRNDIVDKGIISYFYPVFNVTGADSNFFLRRVNHGIKHQLAIAAEGTGQHVLSLKKFKEIIAFFPKEKEQQKIGALFEYIDNLISDTQVKLEKLQNLKSSMFEKMFPKDGGNVPGVRFKGFDGAWKRKKLSELYKSVTQKNDLTYGVDKNITVASMQYRPDIKVTDIEYLRTYNVFKLGDIAFEGHQSKDFRYGRFVENDIGDGIISHIFAVFRPKTDYDLMFWKYAINNERIMRPVLVRCTKASTMMNDLVTKDFLEESILVPEIEEQKKIGTALSEIDRIISLRKQELNKLHSLKKGLLENMFI